MSGFVFLHVSQVSGSPINCLALNQLGSRMFTGGAAGALAELSVDVTPLSSSFAPSAAATAWAAAAAAEAAPNANIATAGDAFVSLTGGMAAGVSLSCESPSRQQQQQSLLSSLRPSTPVGQAAAAAAAAVAEAVSPVAAVLRHGSTASQVLAGEDKPSGWCTVLLVAVTPWINCVSCNIRVSCYAAPSFMVATSC
jgi:hypothetical protein